MQVVDFISVIYWFFFCFLNNLGVTPFSLTHMINNTPFYTCISFMGPNLDNPIFYEFGILLNITGIQPISTDELIVEVHTSLLLK